MACDWSLVEHLQRAHHAHNTLQDAQSKPFGNTYDIRRAKKTKQNSYGLNSYGLYSYGLYSYGQKRGKLPRQWL